MLFVLKLGGGAELLEQQTQANFCRDVAAHAKAGNQIVIVNGANSKLTAIQKERGLEPKIITSERGEKSRFTDQATLELLKEVYGSVNHALVVLLKKFGVAASGNFGAEENLVVAVQHGKQRILENGKIKILAGDLTGRIESVNAEKLREFLAAGRIVVLTPPAITAEKIEVNVDGDKMASKLATTLHANKLIFFSNTAGLLRDVNDPASTITEIRTSEAGEFAEGRMKKKVLSAARAVEAGVSEVMFADGRRENPLTDALAGIGTRVF